MVRQQLCTQNTNEFAERTDSEGERILQFFFSAALCTAKIMLNALQILI